MKPKSYGGVPGWLGYLTLGVLGLAAYAAVPSEGGGLFLRALLSCLVTGSAAGALGCGLRRYRPPQRLPWLLLGLGQLVYVGGTVAYWVSRLAVPSAPPLTADLLHLLHYPLLMSGLALLIRARIPGRDTRGLLDVGVLVVVVALPYWLYVIVPHFDTVSGPLSARIACAGYPVMDLALLAVGLRLLLGAGRRPFAFLLLVGDLVAVLAADTVSMLYRLYGWEPPGTGLNLIWLAGELCLGAAALHPTMRALGQPGRARGADRVPARVALLSAIAFIAPVMLVVEHHEDTYRDAATAVACVLLFALTAVRLGGLVADQRRSAITDALTGLHTRQFVEAQLVLEVERARRAGTAVALLVLDVDHFSSINVSYGHGAGDAALVEIARRLRAAVRPGDVVGRYGGEEFALLAPGLGADELDALARRVSDVVAGRPITLSPSTVLMITVSVGAVSYPGHAGSPEGLAGAVDRALTLGKLASRNGSARNGSARDGSARDGAGGDGAGREGTGRRGVPAQRQRAPGRGPAAPVLLGAAQAPMVDFLHHVADRVDAWLSVQEHSTAISRWSTVLAERLGLDEATRWRLEFAGRLHDIGKIVVPEGILTKPSRLADEEWLLLRQHPEHGARLARLVPGFDAVAESIRQHHERYDGTGYPDRARGAGIRLEARIIAVCDSWAAMRSDRAYQPALPEEAARRQLWAGRGTQFDPDLVDLFLDLHERGEVGELHLLSPPDAAAANPLTSPPPSAAAADDGR